MLAPFVLALAGLAAGHPASVLDKRQSYVGIATFNDYSAQGSTVCGPKSGQSGTYGAAAADIAPNIGSGVCSGSIDPSKCNGQSPAAGWVPPTCPKTNCGKCYTVTHTGGIGSSVGGVGNSITVQIIDACPSTSAANYCKTDVPSNQRCGDSGTNQLDIDKSAYMALTGQPFGSGPTLMISITPTCCPGDPGCSGSASSKAGSTPQTPSKLALGSSSGSNGNVAAPENIAESLGAPSSVAESVGAPSSVAESVGAPSNAAKNLGSTPQSASKMALGSSSGSSGNAAVKDLVDDSEPCDELQALKEVRRRTSMVA